MSINCNCDDDTGYRNRGQIRTAIIKLMGWAAISANPPPGVADYINEQLYLAHKLLWRRFPAIRTERWFSWSLTADERFYDLDANVEQTAVGDELCTKQLDPYSISEVWYERDTQRTRLRNGLPSSELARTQTGWPTHYEIRQCLEIWPAPDATEGFIRVKARFKPTAFEDDTDLPGVPDDMVQLLALAACKRHYNKPDANDYVQQMEVLISDLTAGTHMTRQYIPGEGRSDSGYVEPMPSEPFS